MSNPTPGQVLNAMSVLANNTKWDKVSSPAFQRHIDDPKWFGERFTEFLQNGCHLGIPTVLDLTGAPFDQRMFGFNGWSEQTDERAAALTKVDLTMVRFRYCKGRVYNPNENSEYINHYAMRSDKEYIQLPARLFQMLWEKKYIIPKSWKRMFTGTYPDLRFTGTTLNHRHAYRSVLSMFWNGEDWKDNIQNHNPDVVAEMELLLEVDKEPAQTKT